MGCDRYHTRGGEGWIGGRGVIVIEGRGVRGAEGNESKAANANQATPTHTR